MFIGITTSPRPKSYLLNSINSLISSGSTVPITFVIAPCFIDRTEDWKSVHKLIASYPGSIIMDPFYNKTILEVCEDNDTNIYLSANKHRGIELNTNRLMEYLANKDSSFLICQDDIECCVNAVNRIDYVSKTLKARTHWGCISFYTPYRNCGLCKTPLWEYPKGRFYGELCLLWRSEIALDYLSRSNINHAHDLDISDYFGAEDRTKLYGHVPCLIQHTGIESARGDMHERITPNYKRTYNAMSNLRPLC